jgi:hypothetical protein
MIKRAVEEGVSADYVLMDTWFTQQPLIKSIVEIGLDVIGMVKATSNGLTVCLTISRLICRYQSAKFELFIFGIIIFAFCLVF